MTEYSLLKISLQTSAWPPVRAKLHCPSEGVTWGRPSMIPSQGITIARWKSVNKKADRGENPS